MSFSTNPDHVHKDMVRTVNQALPTTYTRDLTSDELVSLQLIAKGHPSNGVFVEPQYFQQHYGDRFYSIMRTFNKLEDPPNLDRLKNITKLPHPARMKVGTFYTPNSRPPDEIYLGAMLPSAVKPCQPSPFTDVRYNKQVSNRHPRESTTVFLQDKNYRSISASGITPKDYYPPPNAKPQDLVAHSQQVNPKNRWEEVQYLTADYPTEKLAVRTNREYSVRQDRVALQNILNNKASLGVKKRKFY